MRIDGHVHMFGETKVSREAFVERLNEAGFDAATVFSESPNGMLGEVVAWEKRLENVLRFAGDKKQVYPFYFVDPTDPDACHQIELAKKAGIMGYKIICNHFYPGDERAMETYHAIAESGLPLMFHSGILYDGINVSGKYNKPCEFEPLLSIKGLRFSLAHVSWPWTGECIAVYGKFNSYLGSNPDGDASSMHLDITPGTPPTFREEVMRHVFGNGFAVEDRVFWGSDNGVNDYNAVYAKKIRERDEEIFANIGLSCDQVERIFSKNFLKFLEG